MKRFLLIALFAISLAGAPASANPDRPVTLELFVSQGCSACLPANALMGELSQRDDIVGLTYGVDYWDYLGWKDTLAERAFVHRQEAYRDQIGINSVYTPQMVIDGRLEDRGFDAEAIRAAIAMCENTGETAPSVSLSVEEGRLTIEIAGRDGLSGDAAIMVAQYRPGPYEISIERGENAGQMFTVYNAVLSLEQLGVWTEGDMRVSETVAPDLGYAVMLQDRESGRILTAAKTR